MMWSEYALSYDRVLLNSAVYRELLDTMLGMHRGTKPIELDPIPTDARVLDLGAGTGNVSQRLAEESGSDRMVVALENNAHMLNALTAKCKAFLRTDNQRPVVLAIKQDITSLFGLPDGYFDAAILNNVLYSVDNPIGCLKEVCRVLKPNGHVRISGPKKNTNLPALFRRIQKDLKRAGRFGELKSEFDHVKFINEYMLAPMLFQWAAHDVEGMLREAGFEGQIHSTEQAYAGQAMVLAANKSPALAT
jgi:ubiquinone/menaquinone biosynthesis C-methylase UbiE